LCVVAADRSEDIRAVLKQQPADTAALEEMKEIERLQALPPNDLKQWLEANNGIRRALPDVSLKKIEKLACAIRETEANDKDGRQFVFNFHSCLAPAYAVTASVGCRTARLSPVGAPGAPERGWGLLSSRRKWMVIHISNKEPRTLQHSVVVSDLPFLSDVLDVLLLLERRAGRRVRGIARALCAHLVLALARGRNVDLAAGHEERHLLKVRVDLLEWQPTRLRQERPEKESVCSAPSARSRSLWFERDALEKPQTAKTR
jgi:hypothetical protein